MAIKTLEQEIEDLKEEIKERDETIDELKSEIKDCETTIESLEKDIEEYKTEISDLESEVEEELSNKVVLNLDTFYWQLENGNLRVQQRIESFVEQLKREF